jgi:hypothetical protein
LASGGGGGGAEREGALFMMVMRVLAEVAVRRETRKCLKEWKENKRKTTFDPFKLTTTGTVITMQ